MALPTTVVAAFREQSKPFISSAGNVYVIAATGTNVAAYKATDPTTSFTDIANFTPSGSAIVNLQAFQVGDVIHVATFGFFNFSADVYYHKFSMASDTWTTTNEAVKTAFDPVITAYSVDIMVRSDGDVIILYQGPKVANMGSDRGRVYYAIKEAGWTVDIAVDNGGATHWFGAGLVAGSSDRSHFFLVDDGVSDIYQRTLTSANALETFPASFDSDVHIQEQYIQQQGTFYVSGGTTKIRMPYRDATTANHSVAKFDSADAPTVTTDVDFTGASSIYTIGRWCDSFSTDDTTVWATYVQNADRDISTISSVDGAAWSGDAEFYDDASVVVQLKTNVYVRGSSTVLAIVYIAGNTVLYHEKVLSSGGSAWSSTAAASVTWTGASTFSSSFDQDAVASVTWDGVGVVAATAADWSAAAAASVTWDSRALHNSAWSSSAVASVTWDSRAFHNSAWSSIAVASLTWNGVSTATSDLNAAAVATLTWNGAALADANWSAIAAASLTWSGASTATAALDSNAIASLTWNGAEITVAEAAFDLDAVASLTWNGTSTAASSWSASSVASVTWNGEATAASSLQSTALATLTWNATSTATSAFNSTALATLTWDGAEVLDAAWQSITAASLTWDGASVATVNAAFDMAAVASLAMTGASVASSSWTSAAVATVTMAGVSTAASAWSATALASVTWDSPVGTVESGAFSSAAVASVTFNGISTAGGFIDTDIDAFATLRTVGVAVQAQTPADWNAVAAASATFSGGTTIPAAASFSASASLVFDATKKAANLDGWRRKRIQLEKFDEIEEADIMFLAAALFIYLEQNHVNY